MPTKRKQPDLFEEVTRVQRLRIAANDAMNAYAEALAEVDATSGSSAKTIWFAEQLLNHAARHLERHLGYATAAETVYRLADACVARGAEQGHLRGKGSQEAAP